MVIPRKILAKMIAESRNVENSPSTRKNCQECAELLQEIFVSGSTPKLVLVPFSHFYEARCAWCGDPLETNTTCCEKCGCTINWAGLVIKKTEGD